MIILSLYLFVSVDIYILIDRFDVKGIPLYPTIYLCIQPIIYLYPSIHSFIVGASLPQEQHLQARTIRL